MSIVLLVVVLVALQRIAELVIANRNTRALLAQGGREAGRGQYPLIVALHVLWLVALVVAVPGATPPDWYWLGLFLALQAMRVWVLLSLGRFWTTRIITLPGVPLVRRGPYRLLRHPNYLVVALEIPVLPLVFGAWALALGFGFVNLALLVWRISLEDRVLAPRRTVASAM